MHRNHGIAHLARAGHHAGKVAAMVKTELHARVGQAEIRIAQQDALTQRSEALRELNRDRRFAGTALARSDGGQARISDAPSLGACLIGIARAGFDEGARQRQRSQGFEPRRDEG